MHLHLLSEMFSALSHNLSEELFSYSIKLRSYQIEILVQIQRFCTDLMAAHIKYTIRSNIFSCFSINEQSGDISRIGYIGKNLINIPRVHCVFIKLLL